MKAIDILNYIENDSGLDYLTDLHIINDSVVGFYKTHTVKYLNHKNIPESYMFPVTFIFNNNKIETTMVFGSVRRNFLIPYNDDIQYGIDFGTKLTLSSVGYHTYKLLIAKQSYNKKEYMGLINLKAFMSVIKGLDCAGFPFMRIANHFSIS